MSRSIRLLAVASLAILLALSPAQVNAATLTLTPPSADATINERYPDVNLGVWITLDAGRFSEDGFQLIHRSLVKFDLSSIPVGSTVISSELQLQVRGVGGEFGAPFGGLFYVYRATHDWVEGNGPPNVPGTFGVTWNKANYVAASPGSSTPWTAGGEWTTEDAASAKLVFSGGGMTWDVTGIVQHWACGARNYGFIVRYPAGEDGSVSSFAYFDSKEAVDGVAPILRVTFGPSGACLGPPVGGFVEPVNNLTIATPYLALFGIIIAVAVIVWKRPRSD